AAVADAPRLRVAVRSSRLPLVEVRELAERVLAQRLGRVAGVTEARACGGGRRAIDVTPDPVAPAGARLGVHDVGAAIAAHPATAEALRAVVVATRNGAPIRLADVANVADGMRPDCRVFAADGVPRVEVTLRAADAAALAAANAEVDRAR